MSNKKQFSLSDLDATKASEGAFEFEYILPDGEGSGVFLSVVGGQSETVQRESAKMINERRRQKAAIAAQNSMRGPRKGQVEFDPIESDIEFGQRLAACRLVGWRGITDPFTPENALRLCKTNSDIAAQIIQQSDNLANFMKL